MTGALIVAPPLPPDTSSIQDELTPFSMQINPPPFEIVYLSISSGVNIEPRGVSEHPVMPSSINRMLPIKHNDKGLIFNTVLAMTLLLPRSLL